MLPAQLIRRLVHPAPLCRRPVRPAQLNRRLLHPAQLIRRLVHPDPLCRRPVRPAQLNRRLLHPAQLIRRPVSPSRLALCLALPSCRSCPLASRGLIALARLSLPRAPLVLVLPVRPRMAQPNSRPARLVRLCPSRRSWAETPPRLTLLLASRVPVFPALLAPTLRCLAPLRCLTWFTRASTALFLGGSTASSCTTLAALLRQSCLSPMSPRMHLSLHLNLSLRLLLRLRPWVMSAPLVPLSR